MKDQAQGLRVRHNSGRKSCRTAEGKDLRCGLDEFKRLCWGQFPTIKIFKMCQIVFPTCQVTGVAVDFIRALLRLLFSFPSPSLLLPFSFSPPLLLLLLFLLFQLPITVGTAGPQLNRQKSGQKICQQKQMPSHFGDWNRFWGEPASFVHVLVFIADFPN